jgi:hypothetical protein
MVTSDDIFEQVYGKLDSAKEDNFWISQHIKNVDIAAYDKD